MTSVFGNMILRLRPGIDVDFPVMPSGTPKSSWEKWETRWFLLHHRGLHLLFTRTLPQHDGSEGAREIPYAMSSHWEEIQFKKFREPSRQ
jgi:hypothetical protein